MKKQCNNKRINEKDCPCTHPECPRHGVCCECIAYHRGNGDRPACMY
jgi:hypothetical protein